MVVPSWYPTPRRPISGVFIEDQARVLAERFDVLVYAQHLYSWRDAVRGAFPPGGGFVVRNGINVFEQRIFAPPRISLLVAMHWQLKRAKRAMRAVIRSWGRPDVLHAHVVLTGGWIATKLGRELGIPVILTEHTGPFSAHLGTTSRQALVKETLRSCTRVIAVSPSLSAQIRPLDASLDIEVIGNVISTRFFHPAQGEHRRSSTARLQILSAALLTKEKGYEYLLRAARILLDSGFRQFEVLIGGDGPDRPRLEALIKELGLQSCCVLLGILTRHELRDLMQQCDFFVLPSLGETFGVVIGEAMACGKPVLSTHCGGADFQVSPATGILVEPGDAHALAEGIRRLALRRSEYVAARIRASVLERFGEKPFLSAMARIYAEAVSRKNYA